MNKTNNNWQEAADQMYFNAGMRLCEIHNTLAKTYGDLSYEAIRSYLRRRKANDDLHGEKTTPQDCTNNKTVEYKDGTTTIDSTIVLSPEDQNNLNKIMKAHDLDPAIWEVVSYRNGNWQQRSKNGVITTLCSSRIVVKPKKSNLPTFDEIAEQFKTLAAHSPKPPKVEPLCCNTNLMREINIADLHLGKLAWAPECGQTYNSEMAAQRFRTIIEKECERIRRDPVEEILFVWTHDFFNSDGKSNTTTAGTAQDNDMFWQEMFMVGCRLLTEAIEKLSTLAPVKTFLIASNHCQQAEFYAINYLDAWFRNNPRVTVALNCQPRYYYRYGNNLIGFSHGSFETKKNLKHLMAYEGKEYWSSTTYREFHLGHYHSEQTEEEGGIVYRWLPSMTTPDSWHKGCGFVGAAPRSYSFLWKKSGGLDSINVTYPFEEYIASDFDDLDDDLD